ncbi:MAG: copper ion binding protein, partial [Anaerolineales bacterium]|nr:copper ion binding protein [Anaerolineales bacterium]
MGCAGDLGTDREDIGRDQLPTGRITMKSQLTLPVIGMTCANCAFTVEQSAKKVEGVSEASVNLANEKVTVIYDPALASPESMIERIERAGYQVPTATLDLAITGMTCTNCAATVERTLKKIPGVLEAAVNFATEKATVRYIPGAAARPDMVAAIERAGYGVVQADNGETLVDAEKEAREKDVRDQTRKLAVGVIFTLPLFLLSMARDFGLFGAWSHAAWVNILFWALATPVQF